jgi:single-strand DNA-binding protein
MSLNRWQGIGNLTKDPEVRHTAGGQAVANFSIACNERWTDKGGQKQERVEFVRVTVWGKLGELCGEYLAKGRQAYVEGRLQTREWTNKEGVKQFTTEVNAQNVVFLGGKGDGAGKSSSNSPPPPGFDSQPKGGGPSDDDIPF